MVTRNKIFWLVFGAILLLIPSFPIPVFSQNSFNSDDLFLMDHLAVANWGRTSAGEWDQTLRDAEQIALPVIANPVSSHKALVLVRFNMAAAQGDHSPVLAEIYFDAKRYFLRKESAEIIEESARLLDKDKTRKLQIEAICDKRGTTAYSLALGSHRAYAVFRYLRNLGIPSSQISATSFGSHQQRCQANSTTCWQDTLRIDHAFQLLAMRHPQSGCLTRIRLSPGLSDQILPEHATRQPFLQRIHLAESR
jgi:outer membrane protein OmpA-like peptidoglycan-associated protein